MKRLTLTLLLVAITSLAATRIKYDDLAKSLAATDGVVDHRAITIATSDGKTHSGRRLLIAPDHLRLYHSDNSFEDLAKESVDRVEISHAGRFSHHVVENSQLWMSDESDAEAMVLLPPVLAYTVASAPIFLIADGLSLFSPPRVYEIVH